MQGHARFAAILAERLGSLVSSLKNPAERELALAELDALREALAVFGGEVTVQATQQSVEDWTRALKPQLEQRAGSGRTLRLELQQVAPLAFDGALLSAALLELVDNAVQAEAKELVLHVSTQHRPKEELPPELAPGPYLRLALQDDGRGLRHGLRRRALWPAVSPGGRAGLGLARVQGIVAAHGGQVSLTEPDRGPGCIVAIELPWRSLQTGTRQAPGSRRTVLVVDDEPLAIRAISRVLKGREFELLMATGATAALAQLDEATRLDVLVTDVNMPGMGGFQLAHRVRETFPNVRLLFISGFPPESLEGVPQPSRILAKPFSHRELLTSLELLLAQDGVAG